MALHFPPTPIQSAVRADKRRSFDLFGAWAVCLIAIPLGIAIGVGFGRPVAAAAAAALAILIAAAVPRAWLPSTALVAFAILPAKQLPWPGEPATLSPGLVVIAVWAARVALDRERPTSDRATLLNVVALTAFSAWTFAASVASPNFRESALWSFSFAALVTTPVLLMRLEPPNSARYLVRSWRVLASVLGGYAVLETFILRENPLYDWAYHSAQPPLIQVWSVYRATTTLGHPLVNGLFFAVALVLSFSAVIRGSRSRLAYLSVAFPFMGLIATASRGPSLAALVGCATILLFRRSSEKRQLRASFAAALVLLLGGTLLASNLAARDNSQEGHSSRLYRSRSTEEALRLAGSHPVIGNGPGLADQTKRLAAKGPQRKLGIENSWLQSAVSLGWIGLGLLIVAFWVSLGTARRRGHSAGMAAVVVLVVGMSGFNLLEANRPALLMLGLVVALTVRVDPVDASP